MARRKKLVGIALGVVTASILAYKYKKTGVLRKLSKPTDMDCRLRQNEKTVQFSKATCSVIRFESNHLSSNDPMEDRHLACRIDLPSSESLLFGVFDGHGGWQMAHAVQKRLPSYIALYSNGKVENLAENLVERPPYEPVLWSQLETLAKESLEKRTTGRLAVASDSGDVLSNAFINLDGDIGREIINHQPFNEHMARMSGWGSCGLVAWLKGDEVTVANAGDSRAVLGIQDPQAPNGYRAQALTEDQTADSPSEVKRLHDAHPGEKNILARKRLFGELQPLRAFGDFRYKFSVDQLLKITWKLHGYMTPPYLTAEPVITRHVVGPGSGFLVLASDGLWDMLSNEEVVRLVAENRGDNAATHLIRHALGGDDSRVSAMLSLKAPMARFYRDDITVVVIFFDNDGKNMKARL